MAQWDLRELIKASGAAGINGQSFKTNVTGAGQSISMSSYKITSLAWTGTPTAPGTFSAYTSGAVLNLVATVTRGTAAFNIQRSEAAAFTLYLNPFNINDNLGGSSATVTSFSQAGSGATMALSVTLRGKVGGTNQISVVANYDNGQTTEPASGVLWSGSWVASVTNNSALGFSDVYLNVLYDPDIASFNPTIDNYLGGSNGWPLRLEDRAYTATDYEFRWWTNQTDADNNVSAAAYSTNVYGGTWSSYNTANGTNRTVYMRARNVTYNGTWSPVYTNAIIDSRVI